MFAYMIVLILLLPVAFLSSTLENLFSPDELTEMGIRLENPRAGNDTGSMELTRFQNSPTDKT